MKEQDYQPTTGDLTYRNAFTANPQLNPFEEARLLKGVSHEYLSALLADNTSERSAGFKAQLEAELARRGTILTQRANRIATASLIVSIAAALVAVFYR